MICAGIDAGSRAIKIAIVDSSGEHIVATGIVDQSIEQDSLAAGLLEKLIEEKGLTRNDLARVVATGCSRNIIASADTTITEIRCHARGVRFLVPEARTIIEVGGQDSKFLRLNSRGTVRDFSMSDRCAAGSGRFLEMLALRLGVDMAALGAMAEQSTSPCAISTMCVVFAETEIIGLLASGASPHDIVAGIEASIASRVASMAGRHLETPVVLTGGVALIPGMAKAFEAVLKIPVITSPHPQFTGALGAALLAASE